MSLAKELDDSHEAASLFEEEPPSTKSAWSIFTDDWDKVNLELPTSSLPSTLRAAAVSTRQDGYNSMRARLRRYDMTIAPKCKHIEMWDISLDRTYAWPGMIVIQDTQPCGQRTIPRMPVKDVEIDWRTVEGRYTLALEDADVPPEYACRTEGAALPEKDIVSAMDPTQGICTEPGWSYVGPEFPGAGVGGAWVMKFWVPVPMSLFEWRECWQFQVRAKVRFGNWERMEWVGHSGPVNVMVEHLRREREMGKRPASRK
ncbi:uncharacterized protein LAESUDRAFT_731847 [Laetiporus sulphureus 93-53]|uniref:Uncharacterized protein n=1 Tax=Laetiporus sulphureus 93-53 TaxID=1314785 RepID=A0A165BEZ0_9APHY|nr:uncharacterized protein LAESUDRAFT_731847 [Laetiporus sulphureus 93-53]KZT00912.1 hypothetical protein LAESUDRAFT_731847 [Laetiporus sulphureus 93-53]